MSRSPDSEPEPVPDPGALRQRISAYLRAHHVMTLATVGPPGAPDAGRPHAAGVFYAVDSKMRLLFLSKASSRHARHMAAAGVGAREPGAAPGGGADSAAAGIGKAATVGDGLGTVAGDGPGRATGVWVSASVTEEYAAWEEIQGVQIHGRAEKLRGRARAGAMVVYVRRFPFVRELFRDTRFAGLMAQVDVFRLTPASLAFTDNRAGLFGRETLLMRSKEVTMEYEVKLKEMSAQPIATVRMTCAPDEIGQTMGRGLGQVFAHIGRMGVDPAGPPLVIYRRYGEEGVDMSVGVPVGGAPPAADPVSAGGEAPEGGVVFSELPAGLAAMVVHLGPYQTIGRAWEALTAWNQQHGHESTDPCWESYLSDPAENRDPSTYVTEVYCMVKG